MDTTGKNTQKTALYIRNQLKEDAEQSQLTMDLDQFTVSQLILAPSDRHTHLRRLTERCGRCRLKFFCIPEISGQAEESFLGAERSNENGGV